MSYQIGNAQLGVTFVGDLGSLQRTLDQAGGSVDQFGRRSTTAMRGAAAEAGRADDAMSRLANGIKGAFVGGSVAVGLIGLKNTLVSATAAIVDAQVQLDRWRNGFAFGAGGMAQGAQEFAFVREEASRLGLSLQGTATQYMKLVAASRGSTLAGAQTREVFKSVAEASVVMGMNADQSERAMMAVTQMMSKGKVMAEELRGQLGEHLPGAFSIAARAMGVTEAELNKLLETGQVLSEDFLPKFAAQLRKELAGSVEQSALSMQANLNRLETAWLNFKQQFAQSGAGQGISSAVKTLAGDVNVLADVMEQSRLRGEGFWMTLANASGAAIGRATFGALADTFNGFNWTVNALTGNVLGLNENLSLMPANLRSTAEQFDINNENLREAERQYVKLAARLAQAPDNIYIKSELANLHQYITTLKEAQAEQRKLLGAPVGAVPSGDVALARAQRSQYDRQVSARDALLKRYANPAEKLSEELKAQKALLGDLFTPDIEERIRANFIKPAREGGSAVRTAADEYQRLSDRLATELAAGAAQAQAAQQGLNSAQVDFLKLAASPVWSELTNTQRAQLAVLYEQIIAQQQAADATKAAATATEALARAEDDRLKVYTDSAGKATTRLDELRAEAAAMAYAEAYHVSLAIAIEQTALARLRESQAAEMAKGTGMNDSVVLALQQEIDARQQIIAAIAGKEVREASQKLREDQAAEWQRTWDQISQSFTDALMEGGKSVAQYLKGLFRTLVLRPILAPIGTGLASLFMPGAASAGQGGSMLSGLGQIGNTISGLGNFLNGSSISSQLSGSFIRSADWLSTSSNSTLAGMGEWMQGNQWLGSAAGMAGNAFAGYGISKGLSGGYSTGLPVNEIAGIASAFVGPVAGVVGGLVNRAFGRKLKDTGVEGTFSGMDGLSANTYQFYKGGWFRSNKTVRSALDEGVRSGLADQYAAMTSGNAALAQALGLNAGSLAGFSSSFSFSTKGMSDEQVTQRLTEEFAKMADAQALLLMGTSAYVREGEAAAAALQRLGTSLTSVNQVLDLLGLQAYAVSLAGGDMASSLADLFGGLDAFTQASTAYYQAFYTKTERTATAERQLTAALQALGLQLPSTREGFRALVEAQDLTTEAGRSTYATLLQLSPAFAEFTAALEQLGSSVADEVRRLRGLLVTDSSTSLAALQAQFATGTAMARAGDADALARLPELSQAIEAAAALQAVTAADVALMRGQLAASLSETLSVLGVKVPAFEVGTNYVPRTMLAQVHEGEAIVPRAYNPAAGGSAPGGEALAQRVDAMVAELQGLRAEVRSTAQHTAKTARILDRVARDGNAFVTVAEA